MDLLAHEWVSPVVTFFGTAQLDHRLLRMYRRWNGSAWATINGAPDEYVFDMTVYGDKLVLAGHFGTVGLATPARSIATWNGTSWARLGTGAQSLAGIEGTVTSLALLGDDLVAAGEFEAAGGVPAANIARWDGTSWHAMGSGTNDRVNPLAVYNGELILGGEFTVMSTAASRPIGPGGAARPPCSTIQPSSRASSRSWKSWPRC